MKHLLVNPHRSDFIYISPMYKIMGRKSLRKYKYLNSYFKETNTEILFIYSSIYNKLGRMHLWLIEKIAIIIEAYFFRKLNKINHRISYKINEKYDITFCFGFSIKNISEKQFAILANNSKYIIIHLSHYHCFAERLNSWASYSNVIFCADADIRMNYFYKYYNRMDTPFFIMTYTIDSRFNSKKSWETRENRVISTGTFHEFEKTLSRDEIKKENLSNDFGFLSLHPERRIVSRLKEQLPNVIILNSPMGRSGLVSFIFKRKKINQKKYFSIDLVHEYNKYKFSFIGEESISGLPGIGVFESIACGCIPIIKKGLYNGTPIENHNIYLEYSSIEELLAILKDHKMLSLYTINNTDHKNLIEKVKDFYSAETQLYNFTKTINNMLNQYCPVKTVPIAAQDL